MLNSIQQSKNFKWSVATAGIAILAYVITWRFYAMWWFIGFFIDLLVFLLFLIVSLSNIIFCFTGQKKFKHAFVPVCINISAFCIIMLAPSIYRNKSYQKWTSVLKNSGSARLYLETYCVYGGGALSTDMDALYLTDSLNFRKYIGTYDEGDEMISVKCKGDSVIVEKTVKADQTFKIETVIVKGKAETMPSLNYKIKKLNGQVFSLKNLRNSHEFQ